MRRILFILETTCIGGVEKQALNLIRALDPRRFELYMLVTDRDWVLGGEFRKLVKHYGVMEYFEPPFSGVTTPSVSKLGAVREYIVKNRIDIVHLFNGIQYVLAIPTDVKAVLTVCGDFRRAVYFSHVPSMFEGGTATPVKPVDVITQHLHKLSNVTIMTDCATNAGVFGLPVQVWTPIIGEYRSVPVEKKDRTCLWVGRISREKNPELFVELARAVPEYKFSMVISADSFEIPKLWVDIPNLSIYKNITDTQTLNELYAINDMLVSTSLTEGFPNTVVEAAQHGCYPILPKVGGITEGTVTVGRLIKNNIGVKEYADAVREYGGLKNKSDIRACIKSYANKFDIATAVSRVVGIYEPVAAVVKRESPEWHHKPGRSRRKRKQILNIVATSLVGGVEIIYKNLLQSIDHSKYELWTIVTTMDGLLASVFKEYSDHYLSVVSIPPDNTVSFCLDGKGRVEAILDIMNNVHFDALHIWNSEAGYDVAKSFKGRIVTGVYGDYRLNYPFFIRRKELLASNCKGKDLLIIGDNLNNAEVFNDIPFKYIHTGVNEPPAHDIARVERRCVWMGRNSSEKRPELFVDVARKMPDLEFYFITTDIPLNLLPLPPNVKLVSRVDDKDILFDILKSCSIFINTSHTEGLPLSLIEAMKCGCYPICPRIGGIPVVVEGVGGLIDTGSIDAASISGVIRDFIGLDAKMRERKRADIRKKVERYNKAQMVGEIIDAWGV